MGDLDWFASSLFSRLVSLGIGKRATGLGAQAIP